MCLAIYKKAGAVVPSENIITASKSNNDGFGVAVALGEKLHIVRSMRVGDIVNTLEKFRDFPALVHLRMATHGEKNTDNCHPFLVDDSTAFIHNGVVTIPTPEKKFSDTWHFANLIVRPHQAESGGEWLWSSHASLNLHLLAGYSNRFLFLRADGQLLSVNEGAGHWSEGNGVWYSNSSYEAYTSYSTSYGGASYAKQGELGFALPSHYARATQEVAPEIVSEDEDLEELFGQFIEDPKNAQAWCDFLDTYGNRKAFKKWARDNPAVSDSFSRWMTDPNEKGYYSPSDAFKVARRFYIAHWEQVEADKFGAEQYGIPDYAGSKFVADNFGDGDV